MINAVTVAKYFLSLDPDRKYFNKNLINRGGRTFYEGNARLNKLMHLSQNIFIAINNEKLISDDFYAYGNGAVIPSIQENFARLSAGKIQSTDNSLLTDSIKSFLDKIFKVFADAPIEELIEIDHEDPEWRRKHLGYSKSEQRMDSLAFSDDYKKRYSDIIKILDRMECTIP